MEVKPDQVEADTVRKAKELGSFDLSIVLNLHDEARYLRRTMRSLEEATMFAQLDGSTVELVIVLDSPDDTTRTWIKGYDFSCFDEMQTLVVENKSLGASRNDGVRAARGCYIATADGDDLVSYNMYREFLKAARAASETTICVPEYVITFGNKNLITRYFGSEYVSPAAFFDINPYCSRICASADLIRNLPFFDIQKGDGYAFEDWHFNCEAVANGYSFAATPDTILFYRQRSGSIMSQSGSATLRVIPPSSFFTPSKYKSLFSGKNSHVGNHSSAVNTPALHLTAKTTPAIVELIAATNSIEPGISWDSVRTARRWTNLAGNAPGGRAYLRAIQKIGNRRFTDIVLVDGLAIGGAEKFILDIVKSLNSLGNSRNVLVLSGERLKSRTHGLPSEVTVLDLGEICRNAGSETINLLSLRIIQATSERATIHLKSNEYSQSFLKRFGALLRDKQVVFYYFSDSMTVVNKARFNHGFNFSTIADLGEHVDLILSDHAKNLHELRSRLDAFPTPRLATVYSKVDVPADLHRHVHKRTGNLLWASRISPEKRPDLLIKIARALSVSKPSVNIDVYGLSEIDTTQLKRTTQVTLRGDFRVFADLQPRRYDGFLYTCAYDGLPNVILEAMAHGLPVIAPDIGGISEAITDATGFLVEDDLDDDILVARYLAAIDALYDRDTDIDSKLQNARTLLTERHSDEAHVRRISEVFGWAEGQYVDKGTVARGKLEKTVVKQGASHLDLDPHEARGGEMQEPKNVKEQKLQSYITNLENSLAERDTMIRNLRRELQEQRSRTLYYAEKSAPRLAEQRNVSAIRSLWRLIRARLGLPRMGSMRRGLKAFSAIVFRDRP